MFKFLKNLPNVKIEKKILKNNFEKGLHDDLKKYMNQS